MRLPCLHNCNAHFVSPISVPKSMYVTIETKIRNSKRKTQYSIISGTWSFHESAAGSVREHMQRSWHYSPLLALKMTVLTDDVGSKEENKNKLFISTVGSSVKGRRLIGLTSTWLSLQARNFHFFGPKPVHFTVILKRPCKDFFFTGF